MHILKLTNQNRVLFSNNMLVPFNKTIIIFLRTLPVIITSIIAVINANCQDSVINRPNIIWITCEDMSPSLGCYGNKTVRTPNIDKLASEGLRYNYAFSTTGVGAPSRSTIITGMYQLSIGAQHSPTRPELPGKKWEDIPEELQKELLKSMPKDISPYSAIPPPYVRCFPEYLRQAGYYTTNNEKTDYQFEVPVTVWDECNVAASYRDRPKDKPFFAVFNLFVTHESQLSSRNETLTVDPASVEVPPYFPDTKTVRNDIARALSNIEIMDGQVGNIIKRLKEDGVYDNSYIFFFSVNGGPLPWQKRSVLDRGIHIPMVIRMPGGANGGTTVDDLVSTLDLAPTILSLAGVSIPVHLQGQAFLGDKKMATPRKYIYAATDRIDEKYDRVRLVRDKQYAYFFNYMPDRPAYMDIAYRVTNVPMMREMLELRDQKKLNTATTAWFKPNKPQEELYDTQNDPDQLNNIAASAAHKNKLSELRTAFRIWEIKAGDMTAASEKEMIAIWWNKKDSQPVTDKPEFVKTPNGVVLQCNTVGACMGYRIIKAGEADQTIKRPAYSYDIAWAYGLMKNGDEIEVSPSLEIYSGKPIIVNKGDKIIANAMRIGFEGATAEYVEK